MVRKTRIHYSEEVRDFIWDRYSEGESITSIGRRFDRPSSSIYLILSPSGGIRPVKKRRSRLALTLVEREEISRGLVAQKSIRQIASQLNRSTSTISREINRNGGIVCYRASIADVAAWEKAKRPKPLKLKTHPFLVNFIENKLRLKWSPEQISGWLKKTFPKDELTRVSRNHLQKPIYLGERRIKDRTSVSS